jgi:dihydropteroate synthase
MMSTPAAGAVGAAWRVAGGDLALDRPRVVGILNVTPDSFWDGGRHDSVAAALAHAARLIEAGADLLDVGGESTRPGAREVGAAEERARVVPVIAALRERWPEVPLSVDTVRAEVAQAALDAGAVIVNDVSALRLDPALGRVVAESGAGLILMHSRGSVEDMASYTHAAYGADPAAAVVAELGAAVERAESAGVARTSLVVDPGLGFAKRTSHSLALLGGVDRLAVLGLPILVGPSRKRFVGDAAGGLPVEDRLPGTIAACVVAFLGGARLFRVHDVLEVRRAIAVADAALAARSGCP